MYVRLHYVTIKYLKCNQYIQTCYKQAYLHTRVDLFHATLQSDLSDLSVTYLSPYRALGALGRHIPSFPF